MSLRCECDLIGCDGTACLARLRVEDRTAQARQMDTDEAIRRVEALMYWCDRLKSAEFQADAIALRTLLALASASAAKDTKGVPMIPSQPLLSLCQRCKHPADWHRHDDVACLSMHPQPCSLKGTLEAQQGAPLAPFRCLGYNVDGSGYTAGTPESRCGCPDYVEAGR